MGSTKIKEQRMTIDIREWIQIGLVNKWITVPMCATHDGYLTDEEMEDMYMNDDDFCVPVLRILQDIPWFDDDNTTKA